MTETYAEYHARIAREHQEFVAQVKDLVTKFDDLIHVMQQEVEQSKRFTGTTVRG